MEQLKNLAVDVVERARRGGANAAECVIRDGREFSVTVRLGEVEAVKEAASKALGVRVLVEQRAASCYTSDFSREGVERAVRDALAMAHFTSEDALHRLPEPELLGQLSGDLELCFDDMDALPVPARIELARTAERVALAYDPRIQNSEGGSFDAVSGRQILANSSGFLGEYNRSYCLLSAVPIAVSNGGAMQRDYWYAISRNLAGLENPEQVGRIAAERTVRRLGARKVDTCRVPVVFEPRTAKGLLGNLAEALNGEAVYREASFLARRLGEPVASRWSTWWTTAPCRGALAPRPSMTRECPPGALQWLSRECSATSC